MSEKPKIGGGGLRPKAYAVLDMAVELGVQRGRRRAYKHTELPEPEALYSAICDGVMAEICEWFIFDDAPEPEDVIGDDGGDS